MAKRSGGQKGPSPPSTCQLGVLYVIMVYLVSGDTVSLLVFFISSLFLTNEKLQGPAKRCSLEPA